MFDTAVIAQYIHWLWLALAVFFCIIEALTVGLTTIWFAAGALVAMLVAILGGGIPLQIVVFFVVSIVLLATTRKIFVKKLKTGSEKTNVETLIGEEGRVTSTIIPLNSGRVNVNGMDWSAVAVGKNDLIPEGTVVIVKAIDGVKLIVDAKDADPAEPAPVPEAQPEVSEVAPEAPEV